MKYITKIHQVEAIKYDGSNKAVIMRVEGGFHAYESVEDYKTAKRQV